MTQLQASASSATRNLRPVPGRPSVRADIEAGLLQYVIGAPFSCFHPRLRVAAGPVRRGGSVRCELVLDLPDTVDGETREFVTAFMVVHGADPASWARSIHAALTDRLVHEVGEALRHNGRLVANPHTRTPAWR